MSKTLLRKTQRLYLLKHSSSETGKAKTKIVSHQGPNSVSVHGRDVSEG